MFKNYYCTKILDPRNLESDIRDTKDLVITDAIGTQDNQDNQDDQSFAMPITYRRNSEEREKFVSEVFIVAPDLGCSKQTIRNFYNMKTLKMPYTRPNINECIEFGKLH